MNIIAGNLLPDMGQVLFEAEDGDRREAFPFARYSVLCPSSRGCMTISPGTGFLAYMAQLKGMDKKAGQGGRYAGCWKR